MGQDSQGKCLGPKSDVQGGITASMAGGSWLGAIVSGFITDILGRKKAIMVGAVIWYVCIPRGSKIENHCSLFSRCIGCVIVAAAQNIPMLIVGRVINGICVGICSAQVPVYISELAPPRLRGRLVGAQQWAITWGIMIMFYSQYCRYRFKWND
jgi:MFS family permease